MSETDGDTLKICTEKRKVFFVLLFTLVRTSYSWAFDVPEGVELLVAALLLAVVDEVLDLDGLACGGDGDPYGDGLGDRAGERPCAAFAGNLI